ncbi:MAG: RnfABCDGE type electron transport complex subunit G [Muribaculum sp.]|nr:RnfABCDGE type electron transport complex subunit G [Muribaculum sp.]
MVLSLGITTVVSALLLAWVNDITAGPVAAAEKQKQIDAIKAVTPKFTNDPLADKWEYTPKGMDKPFILFPAYNGDEFVGAAVEGYSLNGFSGEVRVMYGFDANGNVTGYEVLRHAETPGLGTKMQEWFRMDEGRRNIIGHNPGSESMRVAKDGGIIDGITAATISSRAFLEALRGCYAALDAYEGLSKDNGDE